MCQSCPSSFVAARIPPVFAGGMAILSRVLIEVLLELHPALIVILRDDIIGKQEMGRACKSLSKNPVEFILQYTNGGATDLPEELYENHNK